jgi:hypothetical protein
MERWTALLFVVVAMLTVCQALHPDLVVRMHRIQTHLSIAGVILLSSQTVVV